MSGFLDTLSALSSSVGKSGQGSSGGSLMSRAQSSISQAVGTAASSALKSQTGQLEKGLEKAEDLLILDRVITYTLYGISAAAALGILIVQIKTYKKVYGKSPLAKNPRRRRRR